MSNNSDFDPTSFCVYVNSTCPVEATIYGYYPTMGGNVFFLAIFAICFIWQMVAGFTWKTWTFMIAMGFGTVGEAVGYGGRIMLHNNPWDSNGFNVQIVCLIIAPAFIAGAIYLTLKYFVITVGREYSRIQPKYYTWIFCSCDLLSLVLQGAGGGIAATASTNSMQTTGNNLMMAGIVWQVATLIGFAVMVGDYVNRAWSQRHSWSQDTVLLVSSTKFRLFTASIAFAFLTVFIRCVYRIAEMANGWANSIMQDETDFIVLDGVMILISTLCLTIFHPGYFFKPMMLYKLDKKANKAGKKGRKTMADAESPSPTRYDVEGARA